MFINSINQAAVRDKDGRLVEASTPELGAMIARWPQADFEPSYFQLNNFGPLGQNYSGVTVRLDICEPDRTDAGRPAASGVRE